MTSGSSQPGHKEITITVDLSQAGMDIIEDLRKAEYNVINISTSKVRGKEHE